MLVIIRVACCCSVGKYIELVYKCICDTIPCLIPKLYFPNLHQVNIFLTIFLKLFSVPKTVMSVPIWAPYTFDNLVSFSVPLQFLVPPFRFSLFCNRKNHVPLPHVSSNWIIIKRSSRLSRIISHLIVKDSEPPFHCLEYRKSCSLNSTQNSYRIQSPY